MAQFVLTLWSDTAIGDCPWACGPFDVFEALAVWGATERQAFVSWAGTRRGGEGDRLNSPTVLPQGPPRPPDPSAHARVDPERRRCS